jgi:Raf kinase inhibitor-like YbhB/YbcL family protein
VKARWIILSYLCAFAAAAFAQSGSLHLASSEWRDGGMVPMRNVFNQSGCSGANVSPEFRWSGVPRDTKSLAVTIFDPDAPARGGWWHWVVFNIPVTATGLESGAGDSHTGRLPAGSVQCRNDYGEPGYGGPCPPPGTTHLYVAKVYALNVERLTLGPETPPGKVARQIEEHSIASGQLTVRFGD